MATFYSDGVTPVAVGDKANVLLSGSSPPVYVDGVITAISNDPVPVVSIAFNQLGQAAHMDPPSNKIFGAKITP